MVIKGRNGSIYRTHILVDLCFNINIWNGKSIGNGMVHRENMVDDNT
jgi:hypothetical protein